MIRVKRGVSARSKHKRWLELAKGFFGRSKNCYRLARRRVEKAMKYQTVHRKLLKRDMRSLWILRINAATRELGMRYSDFIHTIGVHMGLDLNRKMLAQMAVENKEAFQILVKEAIAYREKNNIPFHRVVSFQDVLS